MTTSKIERLVTSALRQHAEDAMNTTNTEDLLQSVLREAEAGGGTVGGSRRRRLVWATGALAAAAAAAVVIWMPGSTEPDAGPAFPPTPPTPPTQAEQLATDFVEAFAAFDQDRAASMLAADAIVSEGDDSALAVLRLGDGPGEAYQWRRYNRWWRAIGLDFDLDSCTAADLLATGAVVECGYRLQALRSEALGRGPFGGSTFRITIENGQVSDAHLTGVNSAEGFVDQMWDPFWEWLLQTHPDDGSRLNVWRYSQADEDAVARSMRLWAQRSQEYADAVLAGEAE